MSPLDPTVNDCDGCEHVKHPARECGCGCRYPLLRDERLWAEHQQYLQIDEAIGATLNAAADRVLEVSAAVADYFAGNPEPARILLGGGKK